MKLLPRPKKLIEDYGCFLADFQMKIVSTHEELMAQTGWALPSVLQTYLLKWAGVWAELSSAKVFRGDIVLSLKENLSPLCYHLKITPENVFIEGGSREAVGYGISTLCQLVKMEGGFIPCLLIEDEPDLPVRGYFLDQARGRTLKLSALKELVDKLSLYKINQFQLYIEQNFLFRGFSEMWREEAVLTPSEITELDRYCRERDIELVPALSSISHLYSLLRTKTYEEFCELDGMTGRPFSFVEKMHHHTLALSHDQAFSLIKERFDQFLPLFSSKFVNICADETFDLGRGKSENLVKEKGEEELYVEFLKRLCDYVIEKEKIPQFWGDVISRRPELIEELPSQAICLAWGYSEVEEEAVCEKIAGKGLSFYLCPGTSSWNYHLPDMEVSFQNIKLMASYAKKYSAAGFLTTDWGDFGHIGEPSLTVPCLIYGALFGWDLLDQRSEKELDELISKLHYTDTSGKLVGELKKAAREQIFDWWMTVAYAENYADEDRADIKKQPLGHRVHKALLRRMEDFCTKVTEIDRANENLEVVRISLRRTFNRMDSEYRGELEAFNHALWAASIWNRVGKAVLVNGSYDEEGKKRLAGELEFWFSLYKDCYRKNSKEGLLGRIGRIVFWYADKLRGIKNGEWEF